MKRLAAVYVEPTSYIVHYPSAIERATGWPVDVYYLTENRTAEWRACSQIANRRGYIVKKSGASFFTTLWHWFSFYKLLLSGRYDAVVLAGYWPFTFVMLAIFLRLRGIPWLMESDTQLQMPRHPLVRVFKRALLPPLLRMGSHLLPGGSRQRAYFQFYGVQPDKMTIAPMTVDVETFCARCRLYKKQRSNRHSILRPPGNRVVLLYVGRLIPCKGLDDLLNAFSRSRTRAKAELVLVGDGEQKRALQGLAAALGLSQQVIFAGRLEGDDLIRAYAGADVFVLPSRRDQWGLVINEAMACGLPIVATSAVGAVDDLVQDGINGFVVPPGKPDILAEKIDLLVESPELRFRMGRESLRIISHWTFAEYGEAVASALRRVIDQG